MHRNVGKNSELDSVDFGIHTRRASLTATHNKHLKVLSTRTKLFEIIFRAIEEYCKRILTRRKLQKLLEGLCVFNAPSLQTAEKQGEIRVSEAQASLLKELEDWKEQCSR